MRCASINLILFLSIVFSRYINSTKIHGFPVFVLFWQELMEPYGKIAVQKPTTCLLNAFSMLKLLCFHIFWRTEWFFAMSIWKDVTLIFLHIIISSKLMPRNEIVVKFFHAKSNETIITKISISSLRNNYSPRSNQHFVRF